MSLRGMTRTIEAKKSRTQVMVVACGDTRLAVPVEITRGAMELQGRRSRGSVKTGGVEYPVIDLSRTLGLPLLERSEAARIFLCELGDQRWAIQVDRLLGLTMLDQAEVRSLPAHVGDAEWKWFSGLFFYHEDIVVLLDLEAVLAEA